MKKSIAELKKQLLFETKQSNAFRLKKLETNKAQAKKAWQSLIDLADKSKDKLRLEIEKQEKGLKKPVTKGLTTLCAKTVGVSGRRKKDGTVKKNHVVKKGGKVVATKKKVVSKKK